MEGFFITIDCSKMLNYCNGICYKIFIDKSEMSIVYELKEWIRFMFNLESCFFLIHDNSVIHELEDIQVLEILKVLELRPCVRPNCLHQTMERNLLNKLNLYTYWNEMKVHKLFLARQNRIIHNQLNHSNFNEKSAMLYQNINEQINNSCATNTQYSVNSSLSLTHNENKSEVTKEKLNKSNNLDLKEINTTIGDKNSSSDETSQNFIQNSKSDNLNICTNSITVSSPINKKPKLQSDPKKETNGRKNRRIIPFSLGALLSDIREKAQTQEVKENQDTDNAAKSGDLVCSNDESEDKSLPLGNVSVFNDNSGKRKRRRRKHKKQTLKLDFLPADSCKSFNVSWNFKEVSSNTKPNHIRFSDADEVLETETIDKSANFNSFKCSSNEMQQITFDQLTPEATPLVEENENKKDCPSMLKQNHEDCEELVNQNGEGLTYTNLSDNGIEKKELNDTHNLSALESLKQKITNPGIFSRFY